MSQQRPRQRSPRMGLPTTANDDPLAGLIAEVKAEARAGGLTDEEIDAELAAYNAERRICTPAQ
jgi:hypothetical protein